MFPPSSHDRQALNLSSYLTIFLPPVLCYYATAFLVVHEKTFLPRLCLLPITILLAFRAGTSLDLTRGLENDRMIWMNQGLILAMTCLCMRVIAWSSSTEPLQRLPLDSNRLKIFDSIDLTGNLRGIGWTWSKGTYMPPETVTTKAMFIRRNTTLALTQYLYFDLLHVWIQYYVPGTQTASGVSIFDSALHPTARYLRSSLLSLATGTAIYLMISASYNTVSVIAVLSGQSYEKWPPVFDKPWRSHSLSDFWGKRWHQLFRESFLAFGLPASQVLGQFGAVLVVFLVSGVFHTFGLWGQGNGAEPLYVTGFFMLMAVGIVLENLFRKSTGKRVGGVAGFIWTTLFLALSGNLITDAWFRTSLVGAVFCPWMKEEHRPARIIFDLLLRYYEGAIMYSKST